MPSPPKDKPLILGGCRDSVAEGAHQNRPFTDLTTQNGARCGLSARQSQQWSQQSQNLDR